MLGRIGDGPFLKINWDSPGQTIQLVKFVVGKLSTISKKLKYFEPA